MAEMATPARGNRRSTATASSEEELREQEVLRATRDLAAYFRGRRTEREARSALKIIKAFIRDREKTDPAKRRPLPGTKRVPAAARKRVRSSSPARRRRAEAQPATEPTPSE